MNYQENYNLWLSKCKDKKILGELNSMSNDDIRQQMCFSSELKFGTAGLRGFMDAGTNCLNALTVALTSFGLAKYLTENNKKSIAVSFDSRNNSALFANISATIFAKNGLTVYLTSKLQPTPFLSYMVRYYHADAGVMITASHNPKEYNGYKVYGQDGYQITDEQADIVTNYIEKERPNMFDIDYSGFEDCVKDCKITYVEGSVVRSYLDEVYSQHLNKIENIKVVFSPLNGTGYRLVPEILEKDGLNSLVKVVEQSFPNGNFTTCPSPNPEKEETLGLGVKYLMSNKADILIATDPDCDRVGVVVNHKDKYIRLSGQETGILLTDYVLSCKKRNGSLPKNPIVIKTIVTTELINKIVADYGGQTVNLLTGFKYIGEYITDLEKQGKVQQFVLGFEESCGYLVGSHVRDKDGVVASMLIAEMCSYYKKLHISLIDRLNAIYAKYGKYGHKQISYRFDGVSGTAKMIEIMQKLRKSPLNNFGGIKIIETLDLLSKEAMPSLPRSNVIIYNLDHDSQVIIRPSGTEPLIKLYVSVCADDGESAYLFDLITKFAQTYFA